MPHEAPPKLEFRRIPSITMNTFNPLPTPMSSPNLLESAHLNPNLPSTTNASTTKPPHNPNDPQSWLLPGSDTEPDPSSTTPSTPDENHLLLTTTTTTTTTSPTSAAPWSSAVGRAATTGKSGRVIEKLMAENDRLRRELRAELSAREELQKRLDTTRPMTDALQVENGHLVAMRASDAAVLARRERKIDELRADLDGERARREGAERRANEMVRLREEGETRAGREVAQAVERARYALCQAEILEGSHKQLRSEYRQRTETLARGVSEATNAREEDRGRLQKLDVVVEQMRQELERANRVNEGLRDLVGAYGRESTMRVRELEEVAEEKDKEGRRLREEMIEVVEKMKWVMAVKNNVGIAS